MITFDFSTKGEKGSRGDKGSQGEKGSQGQKGMQRTCDTKVIVLKHFFSDFHSPIFYSTNIWVKVSR